jgi:hypothetical protein
VRAARTWGAAEDARVAARTAELDALAPAFQRRSVVTPMLAIGSGLWMAGETADLSAGLRRWAEQRTPESFADLVRKVRALRGIAALADLPPLKDVVEGVDDACKAIELGAAPSDAHRYLFRTAAEALREASEALQAGRKPSPASGAVAAYNAAAALLIAGTEDKDYVVPIAALFPDGGGDHVVHAAPSPPTTPAQRFRLEVVSQAEHLRRLVHDARGAGEGAARQRAANELRTATRALQRAAESFGEAGTAQAFQALAQPAAALEAKALASLDLLATQLATGQAAATPVVAAPAVPAQAPVPAHVPAPSPAPAPTPAVATPAGARVPTVSRATGAIVVPAPSGESLHDALASGLSGLSRLERETLAEPAPVDEDEGTVPIQDLLYRGKAALARAIEVGESIKSGGGTPDQTALAELFDLLELATTE